MRIIRGRPPMWEQVDATFNVAGKPVLFTWGAVIYNPEGVAVSRELIEHEEVHAERQGRAPEAWWVKYILDPAFRLAEEIPAHRAEYRAYCKRHGSGRAKYLWVIAARLASPLYGSVVSALEAERLILFREREAA